MSLNLEFLSTKKTQKARKEQTKKYIFTMKDLKEMKIIHVVSE